MRQFLLSIICLLLVACTVPTTPGTSQSSVPSSQAQSSSVSTMIEAEETGEKPPTTEEATGTGALAERFLPGGILEVGNQDAPVTLLVFTEHHCSYCRQFLSEIFPRLAAEYLTQGTVKMRIAMLPLEKYPESRTAALGFLCAGKMGQGFAMHQALFFNSSKSPDAVLSYAKDLGLDVQKFSACTTGSGAGLWLGSQEQWATTLGVSVVPTFFLNGEKSVGLPYYPDLKGKIEEELKATKE